MKAATVVVVLCVLFSFSADAVPSKRSAPPGTPSEGCLQCMLAVGVLDAMAMGADDALVERIIAQACPTVGLEDPEDCNRLVQQFKAVAVQLYSFVSLGTGRLSCSTLLGVTCPDGSAPVNQDWNITVPGDKPPPAPVPAPQPASPVSRILHLSDIHWDQNYTVGLSNDCPGEICCRPPLPQGSGNTSAGPWGDFECDLPYATLINLMEHLNNTQDQFDFVYMTGDLPPHDEVGRTSDNVLFVITTIASLMREYLPEKRVFFTLGNHESAPVNIFPPPFYRSPPDTGEPLLQFLLDTVAEAWSTWLSNSSIATLRAGGYYSERVREGLRVISLQSNFGNDRNFWLVLDRADPAGQLAWLVQQLRQAEEAGDKVHIIGHIPPGAFTRTFGLIYHSIVNRFENTITGQFFGHTHWDEEQIFFNDDASRATSVAYICPSISPDHSFPGYRIYSVDGDYPESTHAVLDYTSYYMNLTEANLSNRPSWEPVFSAKDAFGLESLQPADWADLVRRFQEDDELFQRYYRYQWKLNPPQERCEGECKEFVLCELLTTRLGDTATCETVLAGPPTTMTTTTEAELTTSGQPVGQIPSLNLILLMAGTLFFGMMGYLS